MILIFGGTTEGRIAIQTLEEAGKTFYYSTKGNEQDVLLHNGIRLQGAMDAIEIETFCAQDSLLNRPAKDAYTAALRETVRKALLCVSGSSLNGEESKRLPGNLNVSFQGVEAEALLIYLDMKGIAVSSGAACAAGALEPSHVLTAMGLSEERAKGAVRITLDETNTREEAERLACAIPEAVMRLRDMG